MHRTNLNQELGAELKVRKADELGVVGIQGRCLQELPVRVGTALRTEYELAESDEVNLLMALKGT